MRTFLGIQMRNLASETCCVCVCIIHHGAC